MGIVKSVVRSQAVRVHDQVNFMSNHPHDFQSATFNSIINTGKQTHFGKDHGYKEVKNSKDYTKHVPLQTYDSLKIYMDKIIEGEVNVLWPGRPKYLVKTRNNHITPVTKTSLPYHYNTVKYAIFNYVMKYGLLDTFDGKFLYIADSIIGEKMGKYKVKNLSSVLNDNIPKWLKFNQVPKSSTNKIIDWEEKLEKIVDETIHDDLTMINGIPPLTVSYMKRLLERSGQNTVRDVFPNLNLHVHGGLTYRPYEQEIDQLIGKHIHTLETYPTSEGIISFQDGEEEEGMLLNVNGGIYFEFIPVSDYATADPTRITLEEVEVEEEYVLVISTYAGVYALDTMDVVKFTNCNPYRIQQKGSIDDWKKQNMPQAKEEVFDLHEDHTTVSADAIQ